MEFESFLLLMTMKALKKFSVKKFGRKIKKLLPPGRVSLQ
jgi:hypothetical protein